MEFKPGDRVVCINDSGANDFLLNGREYIVKAYHQNGRDIFLVGDLPSWQERRFQLADPPKPSRAITIRGAFAIDADEVACVVAVTDYVDEIKALHAVEGACDDCIDSGYFTFTREIPEPVELTATVEVIRLNPDLKPVPLPTHEGWWWESGKDEPQSIGLYEHGIYTDDGEKARVGLWLPAVPPTFPEPPKPPAPERVILWRKGDEIIAFPSHAVPAGLDSFQPLGDYVREPPE